MEADAGQLDETNGGFADAWRHGFRCGPIEIRALAQAES